MCIFFVELVVIFFFVWVCEVNDIVFVYVVSWFYLGNFLVVEFIGEGLVDFVFKFDYGFCEVSDCIF